SMEPVPPSRLLPELPRDLETITLKCLHKDPARRYASALELACDLRAFLDDRPIRARQPRATERLARWARRNRAVAASLSAIVVLLVLFTTVSAIAALHFRSLEEQQRSLRGKADQAAHLAEQRGTQLHRNLYFAEM